MTRPEHLTGEQIGRYHFLGFLGGGHFGEVYRVYDAQLYRDVAVKVTSPQLTNRAEYLEQFMIARLDAENEIIFEQVAI